jgi:hypothetical protein
MQQFHLNKTQKAKKVGFALAAAAALIALFPPPAFAYIDPASGSFILQMLLAVFFSMMFMLRKVRDRVRVMITSLFQKKSDKE